MEGDGSKNAQGPPRQSDAMYLQTIHRKSQGPRDITSWDIGAGFKGKQIKKHILKYMLTNFHLIPI